jgi:beta-phosphoglucomutase-like phosphatase (HAD superfamily)
MIKALAFDFDGLILDTEGPIFQSWQELCQSYDYQLTLEEWQICLGSAEGTSIFLSSFSWRSWKWKMNKPGNRATYRIHLAKNRISV